MLVAKPQQQRFVAPRLRTRRSVLGALGVAAPDGTTLNYNGTWRSTYTQGAQAVVEAVTGALQSKWGLIVANVQSNAGILQSEVGGLTIQPGTFTVSMQLQVQTGTGGYGDIKDVISIINGEVYKATGAMPIASTIPTANTQETGLPQGPALNNSGNNQNPNYAASSIGSIPTGWLVLGGMALLGLAIALD